MDQTITAQHRPGGKRKLFRLRKNECSPAGAETSSDHSLEQAVSKPPWQA